MIGLIFLAFISFHFIFGVWGIKSFSEGLTLNKEWNKCIQYGCYVALTLWITSSFYISSFVQLFTGEHFGDFGLISAILFIPGLIVFGVAYFIVPSFFKFDINKYLILKSGIALACPISSLFLLVYQDYLLVVLAK